ncbi:transcriptional regulator, TetR family [Roseovarius azorensis]|uniref:Transcriptional regulator, TetR family n=1 Tax=Roseovarius azorensis TaxID=1287727 RepID=A0A1H7Y303_9RHOB|nr:TetR/AcrR family transcriptional regulator [Roseovarius azorensis]SEM40254.1 transcriptional regulator, TetR family [Roseovarius azorensis]
MKAQQRKSVPGATRATRRRTQDERSAATIENLCHATVSLIAEVGYANLTTTMIAQRADASRGAILHHFETRTDLVKRATGGMWASVVEASTAIRAEHRKEGLKPDVFIQRAWTGLMTDTYVSVTIDMMTASRGDPDLKQHVEGWMRRMFASYRCTAREVFGTAGLSADEAETLMLVVTSSLRGLRVGQMIEPDPQKARSALALLSDLIRLRLTGAIRP